jgi:EAL domain-containing protein (putative c-di-GMP-specific phosphodiesterase class I)/ActR/RegA family two-component response regulator
MSRMGQGFVRVLVVDDQPEVGVVIARILDTLEGFEVVAVAGGVSDAGDLAAKHRPDVALVDVRMPEGGGVEATRRILDSSPETRVVAHSAAADNESVIEMLRAGASGYLVKGVTPERLDSALREAAGGGVSLDDAVATGVIDELVQHAARGADEGGDEWERSRERIQAVLQNESIDIVFQPIVELATRAAVGHEALARFHGQPDRGPAPWFAEAWTVGLGMELELLAVRLACNGASELPGMGYLSVNVSPDTAESAELLDLLDAATVDEIVLEVTEHAPVEDYGRFRRALSRVREYGVRLAIDDAGTGFSSLRHIIELDAELIKLDGSLTHSLEADPRRRSLASALIEFGRETGASVLAEGIESELQLAELRRLGIRYGQGFHLGEPAPLRDSPDA